MSEYIKLPRSALSVLHSATLKGIYLSMLERADENRQLTISIRRFAEEIDVSYQTLRTALIKMSDNAIINATTTQASTQRLTQVTICDTERKSNPQRNLQRSIQRSSNAESNAVVRQSDPTTSPDGYDRFIDYFNRGFEDTAIPKVTKLSAKRKTALKSIFDEYGKDKVNEVLRKVYLSDFLMGRETKWKADFDWIFNKNNFQKILEGNYDNRPDNSQRQSSGRGQHRNPTISDMAREISGESPY